MLRDKETLDFTVEIAELKDEEVALGGKEEGEKLGLTVQNLTPEIAENLGMGDVKGVVVTRVEPGRPADEAGLRRGDVILEVNRQRGRGRDRVQQSVAGARRGKSVLLLVRRGENTIFLALKPPA